MPTLNLTDKTIATILHALRIAQQVARDDAKKMREGGHPSRLVEQFEQQAADAGEASAIIAEFSE